MLVHVHRRDVAAPLHVVAMLVQRLGISHGLFEIGKVHPLDACLITAPVFFSQLPCPAYFSQAENVADEVVVTVGHVIDPVSEVGKTTAVPLFAIVGVSLELHDPVPLNRRKGFVKWVVFLSNHVYILPYR